MFPKVPVRIACSWISGTNFSSGWVLDPLTKRCVGNCNVITEDSNNSGAGESEWFWNSAARLDGIERSHTYTKDSFLLTLILRSKRTSRVRFSIFYLPARSSFQFFASLPFFSAVYVRGPWFGNTSFAFRKRAGFRNSFGNTAVPICIGLYSQRRKRRRWVSPLIGRLRTGKTWKKSRRQWKGNVIGRSSSRYTCRRQEQVGQFAFGKSWQNESMSSLPKSDVIECKNSSNTKLVSMCLIFYFDQKLRKFLRSQLINFTTPSLISMKW